MTNKDSRSGQGLRSRVPFQRLARPIKGSKCLILSTLECFRSDRNRLQLASRYQPIRRSSGVMELSRPIRSLSTAARMSRSGEGSTRAFTRPYVDCLSSFLDQFKSKYHGRMIFLDAPCGDFNWNQPIAMLDDVGYIGADIVPSIVAENSRKYESHSVRFIELDITRDSFPDATIWRCRDCLIHLSFANIMRSFEKGAGDRIAGWLA